MRIVYLHIAMVLIMLFGAVWLAFPSIRHVFLQATLTGNQAASIAAVVTSPFRYSFTVNGTLHETGTMDKSTSPYWWVNSGGALLLANGIGKTVHGELPALSRWRVLYGNTNPLDTDNGYHPQNIFRLLTRSTWQNVRQEGSFYITRSNLSPSPNRNESNGLLLFNRYIDSDNLYYAGVRVDGAAVIKKKMHGTYYTLAERPLFTSAQPYDQDANPNLLPVGQWIGLRTEVRNNPGGVNIKLYVDKEGKGAWTLAADATDDGVRYGGNAITEAGHAGIRTDFMDVQFDEYKLSRISI